jgi:hypothetical protein
VSRAGVGPAPTSIGIFSRVIITGGGSIQGPDWILDSQGYKQYNGTPALGNLIQSYTPTFGVDSFGNPFAGGVQTQLITANAQTFPSDKGIFIRSGSGTGAPGAWSTIGANFEHSNSSTFSLTPANIADLILVAVAQQSNKTVTATALSSVNASWALLGSFNGVHNTRTISLFAGTVSAVTTNTVTVTWSGAAPAIIRIAGQEFQSSSGAFSQDGSIATLDVAGTTASWPVMTPGSTGELYWGYNITSGSVTAGSQAGFTYITDASGNSMAFNDSVSAAAGAVWGNSSQQFGATALMLAAAGGAGNFTGLIMAPGTFNGQVIQIIDISAGGSLTFDVQAVSNVAGGAANQITPLSAAGFVWSTADALWYPL